MEEKEERVLDELRYRLLLVRYTQDDPLLQAQMLEKLKEIYKEKGIKMSDKVKNIVMNDSRKIRKEIEEEILKKKAELTRLVEGKDKESGTENVLEGIYSNYEDSVEFLYSLKKMGMKLGLENIKKLMKELGNPEKSLKIIHVAGTNGKGSVCAMLESILQNAGYKAGKYTSPHLTSFTERFTINGIEINEEDVVNLMNHLKPYIEKLELTFFEATTAMAFLYFKKKKVDFAIVEVGLGGRLDATNIGMPLVSVITNISMEHTKILGQNVSEIAREKAGIIKGNFVVTTVEGAALEAIKKVCEEKKAKLVPLLDVKKNNGTVDIDAYTDIKLNLKGDFQLVNAAIAVTAVKTLQYFNINISASAIKVGLEFVEWPGRFEFHGKNIILDCAHNPGGAAVLKKELSKLEYENLILILGILNDKDVKGIVEKLVPMASRTIITKPTLHPAISERTLSTEDLAKEVRNYSGDYEIKKSVEEAIGYAKTIAKEKDLIVICGSTYIVGEAILAL